MITLQQIGERLNVWLAVREAYSIIEQCPIVDKFLASSKGLDLVKRAESACEQGPYEVVMRVLYNDIRRIYSEQFSGAKSCLTVRPTPT